MKKKYKILFAEDETPLHKIVVEEFKKKGVEVIMAHDGIETLKQIRAEKPDLVLLDLLMPNKSGFEVLAEIREDKDLKDMSVIILSNLGKEAGLEKIGKYEIQDYIVKAHVGINSLSEEITKILEAKE